MKDDFIRSTVLILALTFLPGICMAVAPPDKLDLPDLANRPDRWPAQVAPTKDMTLPSGTVIRAGQKFPLTAFDGRGVSVAVGGGVIVSFAPGDCDLVQAANAAWGALTPVQRAVSLESIRADASLWAKTVIVTHDVQFKNGIHLAQGTELPLERFDAKRDAIATSWQGNALKLSVQDTDAIQRARALAAVPLEQRESRIISGLKGNLVDPQGHPAECPDKGVKYFVLYFGAEWCPPCRRFSPTLVKFHDEVASSHPEVAFVLMSEESMRGGPTKRGDPEMFKYMADEKMTWPAVPPSAMAKCPQLYRYEEGPGIPCLVVVDRAGNVIFDTNKDGKYLGPEVPMNQLKEKLAKP